MVSSKVVLALDSGSQSSRALLFDPHGAVVGTGSKIHAPMRFPVDGAVEQDPEDIRECLFSAIKEAVKTWGGNPEKIVGAALTTQRSTVIPLDKNNAPLSDAVSWLDRRTASIESEKSTGFRIALKTLGKNSLLPRLIAKSWPRQWRERDPRLLKKMTTLAPIEGWLHHELVGEVALAPGGAIGPWPFDIKARTWSNSKLLLKLLGYQKKWLPKVIEAGELVGTLKPKAALRTGLPVGLPFFACGGDKQAETLGAGVRASSHGIAAVSLGTGSSVSLPWNKPLTSMGYKWLTAASAEPDSWSLEYLLYRGMWTARWFAREFAEDLLPQAQKEGRPVEALLCDEAANTPAGSDSLMIWPRWSPTLQHPTETGACVGLRETHTRGHFFRAMLEGIAMDLRRGLLLLQNVTNTPFTEVRVGGGGSRSTLVVNILADVLGLPVGRPNSEELAAKGAAIVAAVGSKLHPTMDNAISQMIPEIPYITPNPEHVKIYNDNFYHAYKPGLKIIRGLSTKLLKR